MPVSIFEAVEVMASWASVSVRLVKSALEESIWSTDRRMADPMAAVPEGGNRGEDQGQDSQDRHATPSKLL